jgi:hypothetical protein
MNTWRLHILTIRGKGKPPICYSCEIKFETKIKLRKHKVDVHTQ